MLCSCLSCRVRYCQRKGHHNHNSPKMKSAAGSVRSFGTRHRCSSVADSCWDAKSHSVSFSDRAATLKSVNSEAGGVCSDSQSHQKVCLKLLAKLAGQLGLPQPFSSSELRHTSCRKLLSRGLDAHLLWCRHLLEAHECLRQDRDALVAKSAVQSREVVKLEAKLTLRERQLVETRKQMDRLQQLQELQQRQREQQMVQSRARASTPNPTRQKRCGQQQILAGGDINPQISKCHHQRAQESPPVLGESRRSPPTISYRPLQVACSSYIPIPVWYKSPSSSSRSPPEAVSNDESSAVTKASRQVGEDVPPQPPPQPQSTRPSRAVSAQAERTRQRRSRTYDKPVPDLIDRWKPQPVDATTVSSVGGKE